MMKGLITISLLLFLSACENNTAISPLAGNWITESCEQADDANGKPLDFWVRGLYEFSAAGNILLGTRGYSDSNCQTQVQYRPPAPLDTAFTFEDLGEAFLQEGIEGRGLRVRMASASRSLEVSGYYVVDNNRACFSEAFTFHARRIGVSESGTDAIDFGNCLRRGS